MKRKRHFVGMGISYENIRVQYDKIVRQYREYLLLYKELNHGSVEGAAPFDQFYWRMTYTTKYLDRRSFGNNGY